MVHRGAVDRSDRGEAASSSGSGEFEEDKIFVGALPASVDDGIGP